MDIIGYLFDIDFVSLWIWLLFLLGYTYTVKVDDVDWVDDSHINLLQTEKLDRDGAIQATGTIKWKKGADKPSAAALDLGTLKDGNMFDVTGTNAITSITTIAIGTWVCLQFDGILTFTHHATNLIIPGGANITTAAGDVTIMFEYDTGKWLCVAYTKADGTPLAGAGVARSGATTDNHLARWNGASADSIQESAINVTDNGEMTNVFQPAFCAYPSAQQSNIAINSTVTLQFGTERFDQNADFDTGTYIYTASVTGKCLLSALVRLLAMDTAASYYKIVIVTSNDDYVIMMISPVIWASDPANYLISGSVIADMDAADIAKVTIYQSGGTQQTDLDVESFFSGALIC